MPSEVYPATTPGGVVTSGTTAGLVDKSIILQLYELVNNISTFFLDDNVFIEARNADENRLSNMSRAVDGWMKLKSNEVLKSLDSTLRQNGYPDVYLQMFTIDGEQDDHLRLGRNIFEAQQKFNKNYSIPLSMYHLMMWSTLSSFNKTVILGFLENITDLSNKRVQNVCIYIDGGLKLLWYTYKCVSCLAWLNYRYVICNDVTRGETQGLELLFLTKPLRYVTELFCGFASSTNPTPYWDFFTLALRQNFGNDSNHFLTAALLCSAYNDTEDFLEKSGRTSSVTDADMIRDVFSVIDNPFQSGDSNLSIFRYFINFLECWLADPYSFEKVICASGQLRGTNHLEVPVTDNVRRQFDCLVEIDRKLDEKYSKACHATTHEGDKDADHEPEDNVHLEDNSYEGNAFVDDEAVEAGESEDDEEEEWGEEYGKGGDVDMDNSEEQASNRDDEKEEVSAKGGDKEEEANDMDDESVVVNPYKSGTVLFTVGV